MAKVSLYECKNYEENRVRDAINKCLFDLGGIDRFIKPGETILIKPNLLMKKKPEEAATTHPVFIKALAEIVTAAGASVIIADSPGGRFTTGALKSVYSACGMSPLSKIPGVSLNYNLNSMEVSNKKAKLLKHLVVLGVLKSVDRIINVPKLKTHCLMTLTGAVKNMFGLIPGISKVEYHMNMSDISDFSNMLVDICLWSKPVLSIMDAVIGMEGNGPSAGDPVGIGLVIASESPYHLDIAAASVLNVKPDDIPTIKRCYERGICEDDNSDVEICGRNLSKHKILNFKLPRIQEVNFISGWLPKFISRPLNNLIKPKIFFRKNLCIGCGDCVSNCPPKAIKLINKKPIVDINKCIRCFCCHELCPKKAVAIKRNRIIEHFLRK